MQHWHCVNRSKLVEAFRDELNWILSEFDVISNHWDTDFGSWWGIFWSSLAENEFNDDQSSEDRPNNDTDRVKIHVHIKVGL